ncbi:MAG: type II secretion system F family protein [Methanobrevibacter sp.]|uniref:type II secretion system F family protein n=1 Tax=Methanobrevibacter sp. TaxID=66852 RepID=UPI00257AEF9C|nr:type II secretion system F family protein [Methanobrevibacter sp.]MBR2665671.1 type II secretion system F family protein [Methanobrevibacter sp.]MBR7050086.1 type II secretion system F family protein [Methanobrevibacter sp.]
MKFKIINDLAVFIENIIPEKQLSKFQEFLLSGAIFTDASKVLAILIIFISVSEIALMLTVAMFGFPISVLFLPLFFIPGLFTYVVYQQERRAQEIEKTAPDFLRQLSSMLQVGLSFENAMEDMSQYGEGPMYDEIHRTIIEIRMGRNFDDAWRAMSRRLKSRELERIFGIILDGRKSGSSISRVLSDVSDDLRDLMAIKRERKSAVMMSVMFLLISAVIATPFSIGMVSVYSSFMQSYGIESEIIMTAPIAGEMYLVIHSILVAFIISIIMYADVKKGIKFSLPLAASSFGIFYFISTFGGSLLMGGL